MKITEHPFLELLNEDQQKVFLNTASTVVYDNGGKIFDEGADADCLYLILEGEVYFYKKGTNGLPYLVNRLGEGGFFGEIGFFSKSKRALGAQANGSATLVKVPYDLLKMILRNIPPVFNIIFDNTIKHLNSTTQQYVKDVVHREKMSLLGSVLTKILHDFKNPFTVIGLGAQMIRKEGKDNEIIKTACDSIESQVQRMVSMIHEITDFTEEKSHLDVNALSIKTTLEKYKYLNDSLFKNEKIEVSLEVEDARILGDERRLIRAIEHLVNNAVEGCKDCKNPRVRIIGFRQDDYYILKIEDNGKGVSEKIQQTLFEPFVTEGKANKIGLGATIAKSIIDYHNGRISFFSEVGKGTEFKVELPLLPKPSFVPR